MKEFKNGTTVSLWHKDGLINIPGIQGTGRLYKNGVIADTKGQYENITIVFEYEHGEPEQFHGSIDQDTAQVFYKALTEQEMNDLFHVEKVSSDPLAEMKKFPAFNAYSFWSKVKMRLEILVYKIKEIIQKYI